MTALPHPRTPIDYPESDGQPMADNTLQLQWIFLLVGNLLALFRDHPNVFVGGNLNWYPVENEPKIVNAPDGFVVFGRPKGHRSSYRQWEENNVPLTVAIEVLSPNNTRKEMEKKRHFYEEHGVEEYYLYDPAKNTLKAWVRKRTAFRRVHHVHNFVSPRLGIRFDLSGSEMVVYRPDGKPFLSFEELEADRQFQAERADQAQQRLIRVVELGRKARHGQATPAELAELDRLETDLTP